MYIYRGQGAEGRGQITIMFNGKTRGVLEDTTVLELLNELNIKPQGMAVELNLEIISKNKFSEIVLKNGDKVEIVRMVGGG